MNAPTDAIEALDVDTVARMLRDGKIILIDVREPDEYAAARIPGALLYPLSSFDASTLADDSPRRLVLHCGSGKRSLDAAERLLIAGQRRATHMAGGIAAWKAAGLPVITP